MQTELLISLIGGASALFGTIVGALATFAGDEYRERRRQRLAEAERRDQMLCAAREDLFSLEARALRLSPDNPAHVLIGDCLHWLDRLRHDVARHCPAAEAERRLLEIQRAKNWLNQQTSPEQEPAVFLTRLLEAMRRALPDLVSGPRLGGVGNAH